MDAGVERCGRLGQLRRHSESKVARGAPLRPTDRPFFLLMASSIHNKRRTEGVRSNGVVRRGTFLQCPAMRRVLFERMEETTHAHVNSMAGRSRPHRDVRCG